jgi:hypothetical protein
MSGSQPDHAASGNQANSQDQTAATNSSTPPPNQKPLEGNASFWSHMFSFDGAHKASQPQSQAVSGNAKSGIPSQATVWLSALKSMQLSSLFEGLAFTPNFKGFALLAGFAGWLFVIQYVKDHDQGPNKLVSHPSANFGVPAAHPDQALVSGTRGAYPFGSSFAPGPLLEQPPTPMITGGPGQAMSANSNGEQRFGAPNDYYAFSSASYSRPFDAQQPVLPTLIQPVQPTPVLRTSDSNQPSAYNVQMHSVNGTWLRTIVTR